jgi:hypothetical protein
MFDLDAGTKTSAMTADFRNPLTAAFVNFLRSIGLAVRSGEIAGTTLLPGIDIEHGALIVDEKKLRHPGDLLHEAGHLAVATPERRAAMHRDVGTDAAEEMMAIAWSYAAALHLQIDPAIVFHAEGYRGGAASLLDNFANGRYLAVPMLQWTGMAYDEARAAREGAPVYPHMIRWLRGESAPTQTGTVTVD